MCFPGDLKEAGTSVDIGLLLILYSVGESLLTYLWTGDCAASGLSTCYDRVETVLGSLVYEFEPMIAIWSGDLTRAYY